MADNSRAQVVPGEDKCIVMASCRLYDVSSATFNEVHLSDHHLTFHSVASLISRSAFTGCFSEFLIFLAANFVMLVNFTLSTVYMYA